MFKNVAIEEEEEAVQGNVDTYGKGKTEVRAEIRTRDNKRTALKCTALSWNTAAVSSARHAGHVSLFSESCHEVFQTPRVD